MSALDIKVVAELVRRDHLIPISMLIDLFPKWFCDLAIHEVNKTKLTPWNTINMYRNRCGRPFYQR